MERNARQAESVRVDPRPPDITPARGGLADAGTTLARQVKSSERRTGTGMNDRILMRVVWISIVAALLMSIATLFLHLRNSPYEPLHDVSVEIAAGEVSRGDLAPVILGGCVDEATTIFLYSFWLSAGAQLTHLGPATATEIEEGCRQSPVTVQVPEIVPGEWRLSVLIIATNGDRSQTVSAESNAVLVGP